MTETRRERIIDALYDLLEPLSDKSDTPYGSQFPFACKTVQNRFQHWTTLDQQGALPALLLGYAGRRKRQGGEGEALYAALGETEEYFLVSVTAVFKEDPPDHPKPILDQVMEAVFTLERLINGSNDLNVDGVVAVEIEGDQNVSNAADLIGKPYEIVETIIRVTHTYPSNTSV